MTKTTPNRPPLSPAAQAVLDAINTELDEAPWNLSYLAGASAAAALRAVAYAVAPAQPHLGSCCERREQSIRHKLLAIAAELEGHQ